MSRKAAAPDYRALIKKSLLKIEQLQAKLVLTQEVLDAYEQARREPIAIIGMGCRFPGGADDPAAFWQLLRDGVDAITEVPADRWDIEALYDADPNAPGKMSTRYGGFLKQVDRFDAQFFGIAPREAISLDPQHRLLLEVSWEALENANLVPEQLYESQTGVFVGISSFDYALRVGNPVNRNQLDAYAGTGGTLSAAAGRLSYGLGLTGPSMAVDTACSSSLLSVHLACQSLRQKECDMALAGGVNVLLAAEMTINFSKARMMAPDGRCKTFDAAADGYVRSEGSGMIVLKRLSDAQAAGDHILAVIRGSAINQDGPSGGLTVPSGPSQERVIRAALENGGVKPAQVSYVEAHGTGTSLGDPIEVGALAEVFGKGRTEPLRIGSLKTNLGHLEGAAGIASIIKTVLALKHEELPPHLHFKSPSPFIQWDKIPIEVVTERTKWTEQRIAGVSSFGFSGTNAHLILASAPPSSPPQPCSENGDKMKGAVEQNRPLHLLTLSAKREEALKEMAKRYAERLAQEGNEQDALASLANICFTANTARSHFSQRLTLLASSPREMRAKLHSFSEGEPEVDIFEGEVKGSKPPKIAFLFTGQGSQYADMGKELYKSQPIFRRIIDQCDEILQANGYLKTSLLTILYPPRRASAFSKLRLNLTAYTQPALFALEYALAQVWKSWGVEPDVVMGHSVGEYVAACVAGVFSLEDGLKLVAERARLMQALPKGGQMVALSFEQRGDYEAMIAAVIAPYRDRVSIAALNGAQNIVISGERAAVDAVIADLQATASFKSKALNTSHAFHSPLMEPMQVDFARAARFVSYSAPRLSLISNLTGKAASKQDKGYDNITTPHYWVRHVREPVRFADGLEALIEQGVELLVEIGPKATLLGMARRHLSEQLPVSTLQSRVTSPPLWLPSLREGHSDWRMMLRTLAQLYVRGARVDWAGFDELYERERVSVPTYPFQRQRYWFEQAASSLALSAGASHPLLGQRIDSALNQTLFNTHLSETAPSYLADHRIYQRAILPASAYLEMALAAGLAIAGEAVSLENVSIQQPLILSGNKNTLVQVILTPAEGKGRYSFEIYSQSADSSEWIRHASGTLRRGQAQGQATPVDLAALQAQITEELPVSVYDQQLEAQGFDYGAQFQAIEQLWQAPAEGQALALLRLSERLHDIRAYQLHPVLLDACFRLIGVALPDELKQATYLPAQLERLSIVAPTLTQSQPLWAHAKRRASAGDNASRLTADLQLFDPNGTLVAEMQGLTLMRINRDSLFLDQQRQKQLEGWLYEMVWRNVNAPAPIIAPPAAADWLIFADRGGIGEEVAELLKAQGQHSLIIAAGDAYQRVEEEYTIMTFDDLLEAQDEIEADYYLNPANSADFKRLLTEVLGANGHDRARISRKIKTVYLWGLDEQMGASSQLALRSALYLVQALEQAALPSHLWLVTRGAQTVGQMGRDGLRVEQAPLWGLGRVIAQELPNLQAVCLDLATIPENDNAQTIFAELLSAESSTERQIAYRNNQRHVARLVPSLNPSLPTLAGVVITEPTDTSHNVENYAIRADSSYLITGGLGALGRRVAHWLVAQGATHLVLTGRRGAASEAAQEAVKQLEEAGAQVLVLKADVAKEEEVARVLVDIEEKMPPLSMIIHAAGVLDDGLLRQQTWSRFEAVIAPKIAGAWNLHTQTERLGRAQPLQLYFSSIASILGSPGQSNYAAANAFMDALAHHRQGMGLPTVSINWGPWAEIGMAAQTGADKRLAALGLEAITPEDGLQVLAHLLAQSPLPAQVSVMPINWSKFLKPFLSAGHNIPPFFAELSKEEQSPEPLANISYPVGAKTNVPIPKQRLLRELVEADGFARERLLQDYLQNEVATVLALPKSDLNMHQPLVNLGLDSLMAVELKNRITLDLELDIPIEKFIEANSLTELADSLLKQLALADILLTEPSEEVFDEDEMEEFTL